MHPYEDWAETFAHYLHILDTLQTAESFGLAAAGGRRAGPPGRPAAGATRHGPAAFAEIIDHWLELTDRP